VNAPGAHPSSEGKRKRNRSTIEAMKVKDFLQHADDEGVVHDDHKDAQQRRTNGKKTRSWGIPRSSFRT
jgi:hypothetical protein